MLQFSNIMYKMFSKFQVYNQIIFKQKQVRRPTNQYRGRKAKQLTVTVKAVDSKLDVKGQNKNTRNYNSHA